MFGPVISRIAARRSPPAADVSLGTNVPSGSTMSSTGCRPSTIRSTGSSTIFGPAVVPLPGQLGQRRQHVDLRPARPPCACIRRRAAATASRSSRNSVVLQLLGLLVGREDLLLVLLQLRRDVALGVLDRLLADVVGGDLLAVGVGDLDVVAEDLVEADLQVGNAGPLGLLGLVAGDPLLAAVGQFAQVVESAREAVADEPAVAARQRAVVGQRGVELRSAGRGTGRSRPPARFSRARFAAR